MMKCICFPLRMNTAHQRVWVHLQEAWWEQAMETSGNAASPATNSVAATIGGVGNNHGGHSDSHPMMSIHSNGASIPAGLPAPPLSAHGTSQSSVRNLYFGEEVLETNNKVKPELGGEKQNNETSEPFYAGHSPEQGVKQPGLKMMPLHSSAFHSVTGSPMTPNAREGPYFPPSMEMDNAASSDTSTTTTTTTNSSILSSPSTGRRGSLLMGVPSRISSPRHHPYIPQEKVYSSGIMSTLQGYRGSDSSSYNNAAQQSQKDAIASHERRDACSLPETGDLLNRHPW
ncbi:uncharacterized protein BYT42DRAFT_563259 [Radiomyces spectabilis]|uniref:uncharacterized protein n=1 Tax=Radiomyces spectabilis TaxID=64574 RepID=UPI0022207A92|nr:uncharacterized protein BYT42DRAFT_563259 [Radiomyces spectabilis]KAI8384669.1 hypothetical protein BYT42DRAFT_563259 [Radiomyces spectabilis]